MRFEGVPKFEAYVLKTFFNLKNRNLMDVLYIC